MKHSHGYDAFLWQNQVVQKSFWCELPVCTVRMRKSVWERETAKEPVWLTETPKTQYPTKTNCHLLLAFIIVFYTFLRRKLPSLSLIIMDCLNALHRTVEKLNYKFVFARKTVRAYKHPRLLVNNNMKIQHLRCKSSCAHRLFSF